ncbi:MULTISPECIES: phospholipid-binding protein MlaC [Methylovorus]|jgi:phospholipid transport system substrate-binding protein|uniref:Toluene tolerance family protein n=1 Tax=Methylovorus glucosotrophus (strain SIP3-4) TaxID=582744 RepID=C6X8N7_METGS|nr:MULTISPECIES: ABC transporter substrate-binding protein [Methylovorus]ACT49507.1 toluene tolerance family protein [Methylovorus glucosotrophus SIP3-4]ADQ83460.1 toluene tolerance family protein [Methylovorus sp. MP688]KAF0836123.1 phospholipid transport system substrate-binding protein [Methylovorus glucosotrophus]
MKSVMKFVASIALMGAMQLAVADVAPDVLVKSTADEVLAIVKKDKDIQAGDQKKIFALAEEKILPNFDFDRVSRMVLGKNWSRASKEQQDAFQKEFRSLMLRTYATALGKYRNQTINYKPLRAEPSDKEVTVKTEIVQPGGQPIAVDYSLEKTGEAWKVYDIVIEGVSLVTNYRGQFSNEIRQSGMDGLIQKLADKNAGSAK